MAPTAAIRMDITTNLARTPLQTYGVATFGGIAVHQSGLVPFGEIIKSMDPMTGSMMLIVPRTRPTLVYPLVEKASLWAGIRPWYWDMAKWPYRKPITAREYLRWIGLDVPSRELP